ncbi:cysteine proteinase [Delitschia confertaspora ATCC 74209]|uniref:ubiquitinyl hydrolase 1 n=1 Tax=Delitschia confertaspora ATCC 74209 TaxID=1513339 RepID=A0A9P4JM07_9PLEO|nr:cysteine proteinase [Delitschia confertaspora ATCC 74209]
MSAPYFTDRNNYAQYNSTYDKLTSPGTIVITVLVGLYSIFKILELSGYPVWLWLHRLLAMSFEDLPALFGGSEYPDPGDEGQQSESKHSSMLPSYFGFGGLKAALSRAPKAVPAGLGNWNNSCYQNSVVQGLASLPSLREYLSSATSEYTTLDKNTMNGALFQIIDTLNHPTNYGQKFWIPNKLKAMSTFQQQDVQEYYSKILDGLDKEVSKASSNKKRSSIDLSSTAKLLIDDTTDSSEDTESSEKSSSEAQSKVPANPLDGLIAQRVGCIKCGYSEGLSMIPFNCLTVPLGTQQPFYDVRDCLDQYTSLERIEGVECPKCTLIHAREKLTPLVEKNPDSAFKARLDVVQQALDEDNFKDDTLIKDCKILKKNWSQTIKTRQEVIARAPKSLVIHINRSIFDERTGDQWKNSRNVEFPKDFDLGAWCLGSRPSESQKPDESVEEWSQNPEESMLKSMGVDESSPSPFQYTLRAVVTHWGQHDSGHYICYRRLPTLSTGALSKEEPNEEEQETKDKSGEDQAAEGQTTKKWWLLSDDDVSAVSEEEVLRQGNVVMLFYERDDSTPVSLPVPTASPVQPVTDTVSESSPLPPVESGSLEPIILDDAAVNVPLPADNEEDLASVSHPAPAVGNPSTSEADSTDRDSEDAPSTQGTSEDEAEVAPRSGYEHKGDSTPVAMRTALDAPDRTGEERSTLPMITAL